MGFCISSLGGKTGNCPTGSTAGVREVGLLVMSGLLLTDLLTEWTDAGCGASSHYTPVIMHRGFDSIAVDR
jgi:hypothetical protein